MVYHGRVTGGVVVLEGGIQLPEGTTVKVETFENTKIPALDDPLYRLGELAAPTGVPDLALNIDHYLYAHPKSDDA